VNLADLESEEYSRVGCKFAGRCRAVMDKRHTQMPPNIDHQGRMVKCFLYE
jgi:peptide/nickel transport system ATP-binding protein